MVLRSSSRCLAHKPRHKTPSSKEQQFDRVQPRPYNAPFIREYS